MKRKIKINLINYLENILPNRMLNYTKKQNYKENLENKKKEEIKRKETGSEYRRALGRDCKFQRMSADR